MVDLPPLRSHLYAPSNNPRLLDKLFYSGADAVVLDLEDAVPVAEKTHARDSAARAICIHASQSPAAVFVRINDPVGDLAEEDVKAVVQPGLAGLRLPKVESAETVRQVAAWVEQAEHAVGLPAGHVALVCLIESAAGVFCAHDIATAHPRVLALAYGAADFARDLGITSGPDDRETLYARSHLVLASRVAGIRSPIDTVYTQLNDAARLEQVTRRAQALGFFGKSAIHPAQLPIIHTVFTPTEAEIGRAQSIIKAAQAAQAEGSAAFRFADEFIDHAALRHAQAILHLAKRLAPAADTTGER